MKIKLGTESKPKGGKSPEQQYAVLKVLSKYYGWKLEKDDKGFVVVRTEIKRK